MRETRIEHPRSPAEAARTRARLSPAIRLRRLRSVAAGSWLVLSSVVVWMGSGAVAQNVTPDWEATTSMGTARAYPGAVVLDGPTCGGPTQASWCGRVLVLGGFGGGKTLASAELYDPVARSWRPAASMTLARFNPRVVMLKTGKVLVVGGGGLGTGDVAELYDPTADAWSRTPPMRTNRNPAPALYAATLLGNGNVLVAGGHLDPGSTTAAEIYDPLANTWTATDSMNQGRQNHALALLADGIRVLVVGGENQIPQDDPPGTDPAGESAEIYNVRSGSWSLVAPPPFAWSTSTAIGLDNGRVLVVHGNNSPDVPNKRGDGFSVMIYDPDANVWSTGRSKEGQAPPTDAHRLADGRILLTPLDLVASLSSQIFDPATGAWSSYAVPEVSGYAKTVMLPCRAVGGRVLSVGGQSSHANSTATARAHLFTRIPTVQEVSPPVAPLAGGTDVTIKGIGLAPRGGGVVTVSFGGAVVAGTASADGTQVIAKAPAATTEGPVDIDVTVGGVKAERCTSVPFVYAAGPRVDTVSPDRGPATGGQRVTISGTGLGATVTIDGQLVAGASAGAAGLSFDTPPHEPGPVTLGLSNGIGQATAQYTYLPAVTGLSPRTGPPEGGTPITITGKGLATATEVKIGDKVATLVSKTDGELNVRIPAHDPGKVTVSIRTDKGQAVPTVAGADQFEYTAATLPLGNTSGAGIGAGGPAGGGGGGGQSQLPLGGGGTGGGGPAGGLTTDPSTAATTITPDPVGGGLASGGLTTGSPVAVTAPGSPVASAAPAADPVGSGLASSIVPGASPAASPTPAPVAPPAPPSASPVAQGSAPGPPGAGLPGGGGDNSQGAPRYAMVGRQQAGINPAVAFGGGILLMTLFGSLVVATSHRRSPARPAIGAPRLQGAY